MIAEKEDQVIKYTITRLLARREQSRYELYNKLRQQNYSNELIQTWLEKFAQADIQSDQRFAEMLLRSRFNKGYGELRLRQEYKLHQIESSIVAQTLDESGVDWFELAKNVLLKKFKQLKIVEPKQQQKYYRFLQQRGFLGEQIHYAIQSFKD